MSEVGVYLAAILISLLTAINVGILALCMKLYTEYFKDMSQRGRKQ
jgi:hypothetical protein